MKRTGPAVSEETATVYRGGGRRFFTKKAAYRAEAKRRIDDAGVCDCEPAETDYPGWTCGFHSVDGHAERVIDRFARLLEARDKRSE